MKCRHIKNEILISDLQRNMLDSNGTTLVKDLSIRTPGVISKYKLPLYFGMMGHA